ncbi:MAG: right-handed parallel beta-helix repeat-containing protein [Kiritimatiellae bacterium]|nr:right-handed parallel beta-helix repeat-containing protein [Kiritimatiellia bacterium]
MKGLNNMKGGRHLLPAALLGAGLFLAPSAPAAEEFALVVCGDGPGALSAAHAAARKKMSVAWIRENDRLAIPRIGEVHTLCRGPFFRLANTAFHLMGCVECPSVLEAEIRGMTNLVVYTKTGGGELARAADGSIESYTFTAGTNGSVTVRGETWADGGLFGRTGDLATVEAADLTEHRECEEGTVPVGGDFRELHFVPLGAFLVKDTPNLMVATRRFGASAAARRLLKLSDETDSQAGVLAVWTAYARHTKGVSLADLSRFDRNFLDVFWENIVGTGFGGGSLYVSGWDAYRMLTLPPFRAAKRPREVLRCIREGGKWIIPEGEYVLEEPLVFTAADSGAPGRPEVYEARGRVTVSGGRSVTGWTVEADGSWRAPVPWAKDAPFRQLTVNGELRPRARHPNTGYFTAEKDNLPDPFAQAHGGRWELCYREGDIDPKWKRPESGEFVFYALWTDTHLKVQSVDAAKRRVRFMYPSAKALWGAEEKWWGQPLYKVENVLETMDRPGEWCLDAAAGELHYRPMPGETPEGVRVVAPFLERLAVFSGADGKTCSDIVVRGVRFADSRYELPPGEVNDMQASDIVSAAVRISGARRVTLENCRFENLSGYAVEMRGGVRDCAVRRSDLLHLGAGGVHIMGGSWNAPLAERCVGCEVTDCEIGDYGRDFASAVGILQRTAERSLLAHNHIHDGYYTGISCGWLWGYGICSSRDNRVEWNHIHHIGKHLLSDMGGIYTLGVQPGSTVIGNHIHDVQVRAYGGWGIYSDEGSSGFMIEKNLVHDVKHGGYNLNYGRGNTVRNNIFAFGEEYQYKCVAPREKHFNTYFYNNIVHWDSGRLMPESQLKNIPGIDRVVIDRNLYSGPSALSGRKGFEPGCAVAPGQGPGGYYDVHSVWADAKFRDPANRDFTLAPDSPAFALGFEPIDYSKMGPRRGVKGEN